MTHCLADTKSIMVVKHCRTSKLQSTWLKGNNEHTPSLYLDLKLSYTKHEIPAMKNRCSSSSWFLLKRALATYRLIPTQRRPWRRRRRKWRIDPQKSRNLEFRREERKRTDTVHSPCHGQDHLRMCQLCSTSHYIFETYTQHLYRSST